MTNKHQVVEVSSQYMAEATGQVVPVGYKRTEVGVIPKEWSVSEIENLNLKNFPAVKAGPFGSALTKEVYVKTGYKIYGQEQVIKADHEYGDYFIDEVKFRQLKSCEVTDGDILLSLVGTAGKLLVIPPNAQKGIINPRLLRFRFDKTKVNSDYFRYFFESDYIQNYLSSAAQGGTMAVLNAGMLKSLQIPLPKIKEQTAIANALSDVDTLINELEKLIAKKQAIKTATMQQLLTGRTRLPQFALHEDGTKKGYKQSELGEIPEDWEVKTIGQLFTITAGGDLRKNEYSNDQTEVYQYPIFSNAINKNGLYGYCSTHDYCGNYLTITARGGIGHAVARTSEFCVIGRLLVLNPAASITCKFFEEFINQYLEFANESTGVPQLTAPQVAKYSVMVPGEEEQTAIATILSDMDADIQTLQQRLNKTRQIKQGMMQELLTGRIRLVS